MGLARRKKKAIDQACSGALTEIPGRGGRISDIATLGSIAARLLNGGDEPPRNRNPVLMVFMMPTTNERGEKSENPVVEELLRMLNGLFCC